jgi:flavorubredoxin
MAQIAVIYFSGTGNTEKMAMAVAEGAGKPGVEVNAIRAEKADVSTAADADGFAFGSPDYYSYMASELKTFFDRALAHKDKLGGKPYVSFGSHGGGARVLASIDKLATSLGLKQVRAGVLSIGAPSEGDAEDCRTLGARLAEAVG